MWPKVYRPLLNNDVQNAHAVHSESTNDTACSLHSTAPLTANVIIFLDIAKDLAERYVC